MELAPRIGDPSQDSMDTSRCVEGGEGSDVEEDLPEAAGTHVESLKTRAIRVKGRVVEVGELLRDGVDVGHGAIVISCSNGGGGSGRRRTRTSCGAVKTADGLGETRLLIRLRKI